MVLIAEFHSLPEHVDAHSTHAAGGKRNGNHSRLFRVAGCGHVGGGIDHFNRHQAVSGSLHFVQKVLQDHAGGKNALRPFNVPVEIELDLEAILEAVEKFEGGGGQGEFSALGEVHPLGQSGGGGEPGQENPHKEQSRESTGLASPLGAFSHPSHLLRSIARPLRKRKKVVTAP